MWAYTAISIRGRLLFLFSSPDGHDITHGLTTDRHIDKTDSEWLSQGWSSYRASLDDGQHGTLPDMCEHIHTNLPTGTLVSSSCRHHHHHHHHGFLVCVVYIINDGSLVSLCFYYRQTALLTCLAMLFFLWPVSSGQRSSKKADHRDRMTVDRAV